MPIMYTIKGDPRTKKNHAMIAGSFEKCPVCRKPKKQWIKQGAAHDDYAEIALWQLTPKPKKPIDVPVNVKCVFYMKTRRKVDKSNLEATVHDILVEGRILADDNRDIIASTDGSRVYLDPINPRVEITITAVKGYEQWSKSPKATEPGPDQARIF